MPWDHCGKSVNDDQDCPICGISKPNWTVKLERTRLFQVGKAWEGDPDAQTQALKQAAEEGHPFCEKCEEAKRKQAEAQGQTRPKERPPKPPSPPEVDAPSPKVYQQERQAEALKRAADQGTPFCQKCEEARQKQAALAAQGAA